MKVIWNRFRGSAYVTKKEKSICIYDNIHLLLFST